MDPRTGKADCGCYYHAEDGIPCEHDLALPLPPSQAIQLGDIVSFGWKDGYDNGTVCKVHKDGSVDVFRPYTHTADFSMSGGEGASAVICYVGMETTKQVNPSKLKLIRKGNPLR